MGFLDPKPLSAAGLDTATAAKIDEAGSAINAALLAKLKDYPIDVHVLAGQSNAYDKSDWITSGPIDVQDGWAMHWDEATGTAVPIETGDTYLGLYYAQAYLRENPRRRILIVPTAVGDTGLVDTTRASGTWDRLNTTNPKNLYNRMVTMTNAAVTWAAGQNKETVADTRKRMAVIWSQGEADARTATQAQYAAKLDDLITAFRATQNDTYNKMPFAIGSLVPEVLYNDATLPMDVPYALEDTPRRKQFTAYMAGPKHFSKYNENVHYSVAGQRERGKIAVETLRKARMNSSVNEPNLPNNVRVQRSGDDVLVTWDAPYGRVTAYSLKTSIDKGATWVDATPARPIATEYRTTVPAATPFWVKVRATNEVGSTVYTIHEPYIIAAPAYSAPMERYRATDLTLGTATSWPSMAGSPVLTVNAGAPTVTTESGDKVLVTNGTTDRLSVGSPGIAWQTAAVLIKLPASSTGADYIFGPQNTANGLVSWDSATGKLVFTNGDATKVEVAATPGWHVVTATLGAAGAASIAVDKVRVSGTIRNELPPAGIRLAGHFSLGAHIAASWSEVALWNRVLTLTEIEQWVDAMHSLHPAIYPA